MEKNIFKGRYGDEKFEKELEELVNYLSEDNKEVKKIYNDRI